MSIASVMPSNHLILCCPLLLPPLIFPSIRVFSKPVLRIRWPKYWSFSFSISSSSEHSGLISFRMDWLDILAVRNSQEYSPIPHFKSRDITLPTKARLIKAMVFPMVMYGCESSTVKKAERRRIDAFELWCWRRLLKVHLDCKEIQPVHSEGDQPWDFFGRNDAEAETQCFGHLM